MITVAVQIQLLYSQTPKRRPSLTLGEVVHNPLGGVWGGAEMERRLAALVIAFEGGVRRGGEGGEGGEMESKHVLVLNAAICM